LRIYHMRNALAPLEEVRVMRMILLDAIHIDRLHTTRYN
jgi:hypothetical protein